MAHGLMVVAGLLTFVLVGSVLRDRSATVEVWVGGEHLTAGSLITPTQLVAIELRADDPMLPALVTVGTLAVDSRLVDDLRAGEPLLRSDVAVDGETLSGRTFTLAVDSLVLDGLGLRVGDHLDVIGSDGADSFGYVVADVVITRLPGTAQSTAFASASSRTSWVTIEVDEVEALRLSEAQVHGDLQLVRSTGAAPVTPFGQGSES